MVSFIFATYIVPTISCLFSVFQCVLALFKDLTSSCFSRNRMVYRNAQHVCVLFLIAHASNPFLQCTEEEE